MAVDVAVAVAVAAVVGCPRHSLCFLGSTREVSVIFEWRFPFPRQAQVYTPLFLAGSGTRM